MSGGAKQPWKVMAIAVVLIGLAVGFTGRFPSYGEH